MATKIDCFFLNDNQESVAVHNSQTDNQYSNLNLNQNLKCLNVSPIQSNSKSYNNKNCGTAATLKLPGSSVSDNIEGRENSSHLNKPLKVSNFSNLINYETENEESKKQWEKNNYSNAINGSTLSLHIVDDENSVEIDSFNEDLQKGKSDSIKNEKQIFTAGTFVIQNLFEFPRQENEGGRVPEVSKFKSSQRLLNPNKASMNADLIINAVMGLFALILIVGGTLFTCSNKKPAVDHKKMNMPKKDVEKVHKKRVTIDQPKVANDTPHAQSSLPSSTEQTTENPKRKHKPKGDQSTELDTPDWMNEDDLKVCVK